MYFKMVKMIDFIIIYNSPQFKKNTHWNEHWILFIEQNSMIKIQMNIEYSVKSEKYFNGSGII